MLRTLVYVLLWLLLMGVAIFATQNIFMVSLKFLAFQSINLPLGLVLVFSAGLGAILMTMLQTSRSEPLQANERLSESSSNPFRGSTSGAYRASYVGSDPKTSTTRSKDNPKDKSDDFDDDDWDDWN